MKGKDLTGQRFGKLTVIGDSGKRHRDCILWRCQCDCGGEILALGLKLNRGTITNCGCIPKVNRPIESLTGKRFGKLVVLQQLGKKRGDTVWLCRCDCGNTHEVTSSNLKNGSTTSCGCFNKELRSKRAHLHYVGNTCTEQLAVQKLRVTNTSGYRGVALRSRDGTYIAQIRFQGKTFFLGSYKSAPEAYMARLEAEEALHVQFLNAYCKWQERAAADPKWAEENPFFYDVQRVEKGFQIVTNGDLNTG